MARPSNWKTPTTAIRIPTHLAEHLLEIARRLDDRGFVQNPTPVYKPRYMVGYEGSTYAVGGVVLSPTEEESVQKIADLVFADLVKFKPEERLIVLGELAKQWGDLG